MELNIGLAFLGGILSFLSPCILPLAPGYLGIISGVSLANLEAGNFSKRRIWLTTSAFVLGFSVVFIILGVTSSFLGRLLFTNRSWIIRASGVIVILLGLHQAGWLRIPLLYQERRVQLERGVGVPGAFLMGLAFSLGWTPCVGPILGAILALAGSTADPGKGLLLLTVYSLGLAVPFFALAWAFERIVRGLNRIKRHLKYFEGAAGILLIVMGILLLTDSLALISSWVMRLSGGWNPENILGN